MLTASEGAARRKENSRRDPDVEDRARRINTSFKKSTNRFGDMHYK